MALSSGPEDRRALFELVVKAGGTISSPELQRPLNCSQASASRILKKLVILGLVEEAEKEAGKSKSVAVYKMAEKLEWFLTEKYDRFREEMGLVMGSIKADAKAFRKAQGDYKDWLLETDSGVEEDA
jgi:predicted transcriptional regulator